MSVDLPSSLELTKLGYGTTKKHIIATRSGQGSRLLLEYTNPTWAVDLEFLSMCRL